MYLILWASRSESLESINHMICRLKFIYIHIPALLCISYYKNNPGMTNLELNLWNGGHTIH